MEPLTFLLLGLLGVGVLAIFMAWALWMLRPEKIQQEVDKHLAHHSFRNSSPGGLSPQRQSS